MAKGKGVGQGLDTQGSVTQIVEIFKFKGEGAMGWGDALG